VAIAGVGNCASSLVQGRYFYADAKNDAKVPGLMHVDIGGYHVRDLEYVAAFDVNVTKVGKDLSVALGAEPNNTWTFQEIPTTGVIVQRGPTLDGIGKYLRDVVKESPEKPVDVAAVLKERKVDVLVAYLPVGSEEGIRYYAEQAIKAGCAFVNAIPVFIGREPEWQKKFAAAGLPIVGDDIKSQVGATIAHRVLEQVHVGPSDFVPWLLDRKWANIRLEGTTFGGVPLTAELKLEVWDSPNSAGVITDAIRCAKLGLDRKLAGTLVAPSAYFMKSPPMQLHDDIAHAAVEAFIRGEDNRVLDGTQVTAEGYPSSEALNSVRA